MEPLNGRAEQISAMTAAVMNMKIIEMMYDDLWGGSVRLLQKSENQLLTI